MRERERERDRKLFGKTVLSKSDYTRKNNFYWVLIRDFLNEKQISKICLDLFLNLNVEPFEQKWLIEFWFEWLLGGIKVCPDQYPLDFISWDGIVQTNMMWILRKTNFETLFENEQDTSWNKLRALTTTYSNVHNVTNDGKISLKFQLLNENWQFHKPLTFINLTSVPRLSQLIS